MKYELGSGGKMLQQTWVQRREEDGDLSGMPNCADWPAWATSPAAVVREEACGCTETATGLAGGLNVVATKASLRAGRRGRGTGTCRALWSVANRAMESCQVVLVDDSDVKLKCRDSDRDPDWGDEAGGPMAALAATRPPTIS
jgi:hypothetical protein